MAKYSILCFVGLWFTACASLSAPNQIILGVYRGGWTNFFNPLHTYTISATGLGEASRQLPPGLGDEPQWSQDGQWIVFTIADPNPNSPAIYIMQSDGSKRVRIRAQPGATFRPVWSPDNKEIAYFDPGGEESGISLINVMCILQNQECQPHSTFLVQGDFPDWSPDGAHIVYVSYAGTLMDSAISVVRVDGYSKPTTLTPNLQLCRHPKWSPDGMTIVFSCRGTIYSIKANGSSLTKLREGGTDPSWSPDGKQIIFISEAAQDLDKCLNGECTLSSNAIFSMNADGSNVVRLSQHNDEQILWYAWLPSQRTPSKP